jgi:polyhydroxyalkanoate synthesis repressor PhaR
MQEEISGQIVIKKYSNRRLYDSTNKRYVTLDEIANLIKEGNAIRVYDTQTGEDISKLILIQVILENEKNKQDILPVSFLHLLIKYGNKFARDFFENSFLMMFQPYLSFQDSLKKNIKFWQESGLVPPGVNFPLLDKDNEPLNSLGDGVMTKHSATDEDQTDERTDDSSTEIDRLRENIKELDQRIKSLNKKRIQKAKKKGSKTRLKTKA